MKAECIAELAVDVHPRRPLYGASDLHLGDGGPADDFGEDDHRDAFEWFLEHEVEPDGGDLTLLGDVFELWQCDLAPIQEHYGNLFWRLRNYRLTRGNHDSRLRMPPDWKLIEEEHGRPKVQLVAEHGHRADPLNSSFIFVGWTVTVVAGVLERLGFRDVDKKAWHSKLIPTPITRPRRFSPEHYANYARRLARKTGAEIVILGHTHKPTLARLEDGTVYANCGCWVDADVPGSFVKVHEGRVSLWKVERSRRWT